MKHLTATVTLFALALAASTISPVAAEGAGADGNNKNRCTDCAPNRKYDSREVIKNTREVDHSQVIETESVIPSTRVIETNHLVVHENETRHVGTVQHIHTIIEKELVLTKRNVDHKTVNTVVDLVDHKYHTVRTRIIEVRDIPGEVRTLGDCNCDRRGPRAIRWYGTAPRYVKRHH